MRQYVIMLMALCLMTGAQGGVSVHLSVDKLPSPRTAKATESIRYSKDWEPGGATAKLFINASEVKSATDTGAYSWAPTTNGSYVLQHKVLNSRAAQVGSTLNATFNVLGTYWPLTFNANGKTVTGLPAAQSVVSGAKVAKPSSDPVAAGYRFTGWYTALDGQCAFDFANTAITNATTLYAGWALDVSVAEVTVQQRYPWNGLMDIVVTLQGALAGVANARCTFVATNNTTHAAIPVAHVVCSGLPTGSGTIWKRKYVWDAAADAGQVKIDKLELTAAVEEDGVRLWENGPIWSKCNVGATMPESSGYYFWWGDTVGCKRNEADDGWISLQDGSAFSFSVTNCPTAGMSDSDLQSAGYTGAAGNLVAAHDAAWAHSDGTWRMPTDAELQSLVRNCTVAWVTQNGVPGRRVTGKGAYASRSIFLPAVGYGDAAALNNVGTSGFYWSSTPNSDNFDYAYDLRFESRYFYRNNDDRCRGQTIRPVRGAMPTLTLTNGVGVTALYVTIGNEKTPYEEPLTQYEGTPVVISADVKEGYSAYADETVVMSEDMTKTVSPAPVKYALVCALNGGAVTPANPSSFTVESTAITLVNPTRAGYAFAGWTGTDLSAPTMTVTIPKGSTGDRSYTATWTHAGYAVSFDANGKTATDLPPVQTVAYGSTATKPTPDPTAPGYALKAWYTTTACTVPFDFTNTRITVPRTLYAGWSLVTFAIGYELAGGILSTANPTNYTIESAAFALANPTKSGYTFAGWTGPGLPEATKDVTIAKGSTGNRTYTATWRHNGYAVSFDANGKDASGTPSTQTVLPYEKATEPTSAPTAVGYTFNGWYTTPDCVTRFDFPNTPISLDTKLYAGWTPVSYTISYTLNGGTATPANPTSYTIESPVITLVNPTATGYTFAGWTGTGIIGTLQSVTIPTGSTGKRTYTATWKINSYSVSFNANGKTATGMPSSQSVTYGYKATKPTAVPTASAYTFKGWYTTSACTTAFDFTNTKITKATTIYAGWTPVSYAITYDLDGGTVATANPTAYTVESEAFLLVNPTKIGYTFAGWKGTGIDGTSLAVMIQRGSTGTRAYKATWKLDTYSITYKLDGGTVAPANPATYTVESEAFTLKHPSKPGYVFTGWSGTGLSAAALAVTIPKGSTGNREYTATWRKSTGVQLWEGGPYWSEVNVGAGTPEDAGYFFWWGDTVGYVRNAADTGWFSVKDGTAFSFTENNCPTYGKNGVALYDAGYVDKANWDLLPEHDAARAHFGGTWRLPNDSELRGLIDNCDSSWTTRNGMRGRLVTGKGAYASKSIFLPACGFGSSSKYYLLDQAYYASSRAYYASSRAWNEESLRSWFLRNSYGLVLGTDAGLRSYGCSVRPVRTE